MNEAWASCVWLQKLDWSSSVRVKLSARKLRSSNRAGLLRLTMSPTANGSFRCVVATSNAHTQKDTEPTYMSWSPRCKLALCGRCWPCWTLLCMTDRIRKAGNELTDHKSVSVSQRSSKLSCAVTYRCRWQTFRTSYWPTFFRT